MNKKGDEPLKNTTISSVILVLTLVLIGIIALKFMAFGAQQCPAGFEFLMRKRMDESATADYLILCFKDDF